MAELARDASAAVEINVHFPTGSNLLAGAIRNGIETSAALSEAEGLSDWRQGARNLRGAKNACRRVQELKRSTVKEPRSVPPIWRRSAPPTATTCAWAMTSLLVLYSAS